jgi:hypothetical protein
LESCAPGKWVRVRTMFFTYLLIIVTGLAVYTAIGLAHH